MVWGRKENCLFFTLLLNAFDEYGIKGPPKRSNFHLSNREELIKLIEEQGFNNVLSWY